MILSRSRSRSITSHKLFPKATLLVPSSEAENYAHTGLEIETIPDEVAGISAVRNWVLRHFKEDAVVMLDDDISACVCTRLLSCYRTDKGARLYIITEASREMTAVLLPEEY